MVFENSVLSEFSSTGRVLLVPPAGPPFLTGNSCGAPPPSELLPFVSHHQLATVCRLPGLFFFVPAMFVFESLS